MKNLITLLAGLLIANSISSFGQHPDVTTVSPNPATRSLANTLPHASEQGETVQGLFNTDRSKVNCNSIEDNAPDELLNTQTPVLIKQLTSAFGLDSVNSPITYGFVKGDAKAYAVLIGACEKQYRGKGKKLILIGENIVDIKQPDLEKKLTLVAVIAHEMTHFKQQALQIRLVDKEVELHADFMAGWYLARYVANMSLERAEKLRSVMAALSKFYYFGEDEKPSVVYGTPENRLQISLDGYQEKSTDANTVYSKGIALVKRNPIYWNVPTELGLPIKESSINATGQEESIKVLNTRCPGRFLLNPDNGSLHTAFSCQISAPANLGTATTYQTSSELFDALTKAFLSYLPPDTRKKPGSDYTEFDILDPSYIVRQVYVAKEEKGVSFTIVVQVGLINLASKNEIGIATPEVKEIERQIFDLARKPESVNIEKLSLFGQECRVTAKPAGTRLVTCDAGSIDFERAKKIMYSLIPKGFRLVNSSYAFIALNNEEKGKEDYSKREYVRSPINFISLQRVDDRVSHIQDPSEGNLIISVNSGATVASVITQKRTPNALGLEFEQRTSVMTKSEKQFPVFSLANMSCDVDEVDDYSWVVVCEIKPDAQKGESLDAIFGAVRDGIASWAQPGWEENESDTTYTLRSPEQISELPNVDDIEVQKGNGSVELRFYVPEKNSKVKYGSSNSKPNKLGHELLSGIKSLTNINIDTTPSFRLFGRSCEIQYMDKGFANHVTCWLTGSKAENAKVFDQLKEAVISILPPNWRYRIEKTEFASARIGKFVCPTTPEYQSLMCFPVQIYFDLKATGAIQFNIDFYHDQSKLKK